MILESVIWYFFSCDMLVFYVGCRFIVEKRILLCKIDDFVFSSGRVI